VIEATLPTSLIISGSGSSRDEKQQGYANIRKGRKSGLVFN